jgi:hypothetical protein
VRGGVQYLDWLVSGIGRADVPDHRHAAWKLKGSFFLGVWEPSPSEVFNEPGDLHPESSQLGMDATWDHDGLFKLAAGHEPWVVEELDKLHR